MIQQIVTFGYNYGKPEAFLIDSSDQFEYIDVRSLKGPEKKLRDKYVGTNKDVRASIMKDKRNLKTLASIWSKLDRLYSSPTKYFIAIGCNEGKHRSVTLGILAKEKYHVECHHRDIAK